MQPNRVRWCDRHKEEHGCLTASSFGCALGLKGKVYHYVDYLRNHSDTDDAFRGNLATFHGQRTEDISKMVYERLVNGNQVVEDGGFFICPEHPLKLAATPDGIVSWRPRPTPVFSRSEDSSESSSSSRSVTSSSSFMNQQQQQLQRWQQNLEQRIAQLDDSSRADQIPFRILEIKSPVMSLYDCSRDDNTAHGIPKAYMCQMQGQLFFSGAEECDFFVFVAKAEEVACWRVYRSQAFYDWMRPKLLQVCEWVAAKPRGKDEHGNPLLPTHQLLPSDFKFEPFDFNSVRVEPLVMPSSIPKNLPIRDARRFGWFYQQQNHLLQANFAATTATRWNNNNSNAAATTTAAAALNSYRTQQQLQLVDPESLVPRVPQPGSMVDPFLQLIATQAVREGDWVLWQKGARVLAIDESDHDKSGNNDQEQLLLLLSQDGQRKRRGDEVGADDEEMGMSKQLAMTGGGSQKQNTSLIVGSQQPLHPQTPKSGDGTASAAVATVVAANGGGVGDGRVDGTRKPHRSPSIALTPSRCCCCGIKPPARAAPPSLAPASAASSSGADTSARGVAVARALLIINDDHIALASDCTTCTNNNIIINNNSSDDEFSKMPRIARVVKLCASTGLVELEVLAQRPVVAAARAMARKTANDGGKASSSSGSSLSSSHPSSPFLLTSGTGATAAASFFSNGDKDNHYHRSTAMATTPLFDMNRNNGNNSKQQHQQQQQHHYQNPASKRKISYFTPSLGLLPQLFQCRSCGGLDERKQQQQDQDENSCEQQQQQQQQQVVDESTLSIAEQQERAQKQKRERQKQQQASRFSIFDDVDTRDQTSRVFANPATDSMVIVRRRGRPVRDEEDFWRKSNPNSLSWQSLNRKKPAPPKTQQLNDNDDDDDGCNHVAAARATKLSIIAVESAAQLEENQFADGSEDINSSSSSSKKKKKKAYPHHSSGSRHRFYNALACELVQQLWHNPMAVLLRSPNCSTAACLSESLRQLRLIVGGDVLRVPVKSAAALWHIASMLSSPLSSNLSQNSQNSQAGKFVNANNSNTSNSGMLIKFTATPAMRGWVTDSFQLGSLCHKMFLRTIQAAGSVKKFALSNEICAVMTMTVFRTILSSGAAGRRRASPLMPPPSPVVLRRIFCSPQFEEDPQAYLESLDDGDSIGTWAHNSSTLFASGGGGSRGEFVSLQSDSQKQSLQQQQQHEKTNRPAANLVSANSNNAPAGQALKITRFKPPQQQEQQQQQQQSSSTTLNTTSPIIVNNTATTMTTTPALKGPTRFSAAVQQQQQQQQSNSSNVPPLHLSALGGRGGGSSSGSLFPLSIPGGASTGSGGIVVDEPIRTDAWKSPVWIVCSEVENSNATPDIYEVSVAAANRDEHAPWIWFVN